MEAATLTGLLKAAAARFPSRRGVLVPGDVELTHGALDSLVDAAAARLATDAGVLPGNTVALVFPSNIELAVILLAVIRAGAVAAPLNPTYTAEVFEFYLSDTQPHLLITSTPGNAAAEAAATKLGIVHASASLENVAGSLHLSGLPPAGSDSAMGRPSAVTRDGPGTTFQDVAMLAVGSHSSGTASRPNAVAITHAELIASVQIVRSAYRLTERDATVMVLPLFEVPGIICVLLASLVSGSCVALPVAGRFWELVRASGATWYMAAPTIHQKLLHHHAAESEAPYPALRFIRSCGPSLAPGMLHKLEAAFGVPVFDDNGFLHLPGHVKELINRGAEDDVERSTSVPQVRRQNRCEHEITIEEPSAPAAPRADSKLPVRIANGNGRVSFDAGSAMLLSVFGTLLALASGIWLNFPTADRQEPPRSLSETFRRHLWLAGLLIIILISTGMIAVLMTAIISDRASPKNVTRSLGVTTIVVLVVVAATVAVSVEGWVLVTCVFAVISIGAGLAVLYAIGELREKVTALRKFCKAAFSCAHEE